MRHRSAVAATGLALIVATTYGFAGAADQCPELTRAKAALNSAKASLKNGTRTLAGAKQQDVQAPRGQDIQSPRGQDIQSPRGQDIQSPRSPQELPVPRGQQVQASRVTQAEALVKESEAACLKGDRALSANKANEALKLLEP